MFDPKAFDGLLKSCRMVDISHLIEEEMPVTLDHPYYFHNRWNGLEYGLCSNSYLMSLHEHTGTHIDAPYHFFDGQTTIEKLPLENFFAPCVKMDFELKDGAVEITADMIRAWEASHRPLTKGDAVLLNVGWAKHWQKRPALQFGKDWPGLSRDGAAYLLECGISIVGTEAFSIDPMCSSDLPAHKILLSNGILIIECLCNLEQLPDYGYLMVLPLPIKDGSASPIRAVVVCD